MSVFSELFGGALRGFEAEEVLKGVATRATAQVARGPLSSAFQKMRAEGRRTLAGKLRKCADHLEKGECNAAADMAADVIDDIKL